MEMELLSNSSPNTFLDPHVEICQFPEMMCIMISLLVCYVLLSPLFLYVLAVGYQRWRNEGFLSAFTTWSHIDVLTYNVVVLDLLNVLGTFFFVFGILTEKPGFQLVGSCMFSFLMSAQTLFHLLTCLERYLAVVHPIIYLRLKRSEGIKLRNVAIGCVWLISIAVMILITQRVVSFAFLNQLLLSFTSVAFFFCSLSVICALTRPGPKKGCRTRNTADQSKQRALYIMIVVTGTLFLRFLSNMITQIIQALQKHFGQAYCLIVWSSMWFFMPSSLVLPLLFLQRTGKLHVCVANTR